MAVVKTTINSINMTVLGRFNPAILRHDFLVRECEFDLGAPTSTTPTDVPMVSEINYPNIRWFMDFDRMVVEETGLLRFADFRGLLLAERYLDVLKHTPLTAAGLNFQADFAVPSAITVWTNLVRSDSILAILDDAQPGSIELTTKYRVLLGDQHPLEARVFYIDREANRLLLVVSQVDHSEVMRAHFNWEVQQLQDDRTRLQRLRQHYDAIVRRFESLIDALTEEVH